MKKRLELNYEETQEVVATGVEHLYQELGGKVVTFRFSVKEGKLYLTLETED